jgi:hypothetical protein
VLSIGLLLLSAFATIYYLTIAAKEDAEEQNSHEVKKK